MSILNLIKKSLNKPAACQEYTYVLAKHYKGFKKMGLEIHFDPVTRENNLKFLDVDVTGKTLTIKDVAPDRMELWLDGLIIAIIPDEKNRQAIRDGKVTDVYLRMDEDHIIHDIEKNDVETRHRFKMFVKSF